MVDSLTVQQFSAKCKATMRVLYYMRRIRRPLLTLVDRASGRIATPKGASPHYKTMLKLFCCMQRFMAELAELWDVSLQEVYVKTPKCFFSQNEDMIHSSVQRSLYRAYIAAGIAQELGFKYERMAKDIADLRDRVQKYLAQWSNRAGAIFFLLQMFPKYTADKI